MTTEIEWQQITQAEQAGSTSFVLFGNDTRTRRVSIIPDLHCPFHSPERVAEAELQSRGADHIIFLGDGWDAYWLSSFDKDPLRREHTQDELDSLVAILTAFRHANPEARIDYCYGNHDLRLIRYLRSSAPGLASLRELDMRRLLNLDELRINSHGRDGFKCYGLRFKHGDLVRSKAGYTARAEMEAHRCSGFSGHTHRLGAARATDKEGVTTEWWESGHLCDETKADYTSSPDWQAGFLLLDVHPSGEVEVTPVHL